MYHNDNRSPREQALRRLVARSATPLTVSISILLTIVWVGYIIYWLYSHIR